jgi:hypothetical protein
MPVIQKYVVCVLTLQPSVVSAFWLASTLKFNFNYLNKVDHCTSQVFVEN